MDLVKKSYSYIKQSLIYCSVCQEIVKDPVLLKCNHCFCDSCLKKYMLKTEKIKNYCCPNCFSIFNRRTIYKAPALDCTIYENLLLRLEKESEIDLSNVKPEETPATLKFSPERCKIKHNIINLNEQPKLRKCKSATNIAVKDISIQITPFDNKKSIKRKNDNKEESLYRKKVCTTNVSENNSEQRIPLNEIQTNGNVSNSSSSNSFNSSIFNSSRIKALKQVNQSFEKVEDWIRNQQRNERSKSLIPAEKDTAAKREASAYSDNELEDKCLNNLQQMAAKKNDWKRIKKNLPTSTYKKLNILVSKSTKTSGQKNSNTVLEEIVLLGTELCDEILSINDFINNKIFNESRNKALQLRKLLKTNINFNQNNDKICIDKSTNTVSPVLPLTQKINLISSESDDVTFYTLENKGEGDNKQKANSFSNADLKQKKGKLPRIETSIEIAESSSDDDDLIESTPDETNSNKKRFMRRNSISKLDNDSFNECLSVIPGTEITQRKPIRKLKNMKQCDDDNNLKLNISLIEPIRTQLPTSIPFKEITPPPDFMDTEISSNVACPKQITTHDLENFSVLPPETTIIKNVETPKSIISMDKLKEAPILTNFETQQSQVQPTYTPSRRTTARLSSKMSSRINSSDKLPKTSNQTLSRSQVDVNSKNTNISIKSVEKLEETILANLELEFATIDNSDIESSFYPPSSRKSVTPSKKMQEQNRNISDAKTEQNQDILMVTKKKGTLLAHIDSSNFKQMSVLNYVENTSKTPASKERTTDTNQFKPQTPYTLNASFTQNWQNPTLIASTPISTTPRNQQLNRKMELMSTRLSSTESKIVQKFAVHFNVSYTTENSGTATHLITQVDDEQAVEALTAKYVCAVAMGIWVVSFKWIEDCLDAKKLLPEEKYEVLDPGKTCGPKNSRLEGKPSKLFDDFHIHIVSEPTTFPMEKLQYCLKINGAHIYLSLGSLIRNQDGIPLIIAEGESEDDVHQECYDRYGIISVSKEWLFQSIGRYKIESLVNYLLCNINEQPEKYPLHLFNESQTQTSL